jgi:hypothetical protein
MDGREHAVYFIKILFVLSDLSELVSILLYWLLRSNNIMVVVDRTDRIIWHQEQLGRYLTTPRCVSSSCLLYRRLPWLH